MMAHIIADPMAAIVQGGKRITAVSNVLSRIDPMHRDQTGGDASNLQ